MSGGNGTLLKLLAQLETLMAQRLEGFFRVDILTIHDILTLQFEGMQF